MVKTIHPAAIKKMISYYYLVSFCPPRYIDILKEASLELRNRLAEGAGCKMQEFKDLVVPEVARRISAFHLASREPDPEAVEALVEVMKIADNGPKETAAYQGIMHLVSSHPNRAKLTNRLHRKKGCIFCTAPCRYGFFTLVSEPDFKALQSMLDEENQKLAQERDAVRVLWTYTKHHIWHVLETENGIINPEHLGNLSYCLLLLGTAKSRFALPETQLRRYQEMRRASIQRLKNTPLLLT